MDKTCIDCGINSFIQRHSKHQRCKDCKVKHDKINKKLVMRDWRAKNPQRNKEIDKKAKLKYKVKYDQEIDAIIGYDNRKKLEQAGFYFKK